MTEDPHKPKGDEEDRDYYRVLSDVMSDQKEREKRRSESAVRRASRGGNSTVPGIVAMVCGVLSVYFWTSPPQFIQPDPLVEYAMEDFEAGARLEIIAQAGRVDWFIRENGRLPRTLEETGAVINEEMIFTRGSGESYELTLFYGPDGPEQERLTYASGEDLQAFQAGAATRVDRRLGDPPAEAASPAGGAP